MTFPGVSPSAWPGDSPVAGTEFVFRFRRRHVAGFGANGAQRADVRCTVGRLPPEPAQERQCQQAQQCGRAPAGAPPDSARVPADRAERGRRAPRQGKQAESRRAVRTRSQRPQTACCRRCADRHCPERHCPVAGSALARSALARIDTGRNSRMVARHVPIVRSMRRADQGYRGLCGYSGTRGRAGSAGREPAILSVPGIPASRRAGRPSLWDLLGDCPGVRRPLALTEFHRSGLSASCCTRRGFKQAGSGRENRGTAAETIPRAAPQRPPPGCEEGRVDVWKEIGGFPVAPVSRPHRPAGYQAFR